MESGTLDFEDLMDTGDFPGFEIAKFTPATDDKEADDGDGILRTPEHRREDDDDDFVLQQTNNLKPEKVITENGDCNDMQNHDQEPSKDEEIKKQEQVKATDPTCNKDEAETSINDLPGVDFEADETAKSKPDESGEKEEEDFVVEVNEAWDDKEEEEPTPKKKKMSLMPPKPKMKLWGGNQKQEVDVSVSKTVDESNEKATDETETEKIECVSENEQSNNADVQSEKKDVIIVSPEKEHKKPKDEEEAPHQQSFLSFFNLQPGSSKPKDQTKQKQEKTKTEDFFSRKRLRTRKKVSYCEDVVVDVGDDYQDDDEEEPFDHEINLPRRRRSSLGKEVKQSPVANNAVLAAAKYAEALKKLSNMHSTSLPSPILKPVRPTSQPHSTAQMYRNILPNLKQNEIIVDGQSSNGPMKGLFECGLCGTFFSTAGQFITHQETAHTTEKQASRGGMETFRCEVCQFVLTNRFAYLEHKRMKHSKNQVTFNCNKCGSSFGYLIDLQKHKQVCGLPYTYTCTHCNLQMKDIHEMTAHNNKFHSQPTSAPLVSQRQWLSCAVRNCNFKSLTQMEMKHHVQKNHNALSKNMVNELFPCNAPRCSKIFSTRERLTDHKREVHASEFIVQYQCMECKSCFSTKTLLAEHQYLHMMDKMKKCDICMRRFNTYSQLVKHKEVHAAKGIYRCTSCTRWCEDKQELSSHVCREKRAKLLGVRIYFCDICQRDFKSDELMFQHRQEHKRFYQCSTCKWEGKEEEAYFVHRELHGLYTCRECCEEIPTEIEMATHRKAHKYYIKMEEVEEEDGSPISVMYLCPSLMNAIKA